MLMFSFSKYGSFFEFTVSIYIPVCSFKVLVFHILTNSMYYPTLNYTLLLHSFHLFINALFKQSTFDCPNVLSVEVWSHKHKNKIKCVSFRSSITKETEKKIWINLLQEKGTLFQVREGVLRKASQRQW